jgi:hypothetical protein
MTGQCCGVLVAPNCTHNEATQITNAPAVSRAVLADLRDGRAGGPDHRQRGRHLHRQPAHAQLRPTLVRRAPSPRGTSLPRQVSQIARKVLGRPKICKLAHAFPWEYRYKRLQSVQRLGRHGAFLTLCGGPPPDPAPGAATQVEHGHRRGLHRAITIRLSLRSAAQPLYTRFPILRYHSQWLFF